MADFNGDGNHDFATLNYGLWESVSVLLGNGTGTLGAPTSFTTRLVPPSR